VAAVLGFGESLRIVLLGGSFFFFFFFVLFFFFFRFVICLSFFALIRFSAFCLLFHDTARRTWIC